METVNFSELTPEERQIWCDVFVHEIQRHWDDIAKIRGYLADAKEYYHIEPRRVYVNKWIEVNKP
jgi:poly(3-hydroxybutyrate) depolymerase